MTTQISGDTGVSQCQPGSVSQDDLAANVVGKGTAGTLNFGADSFMTGCLVRAA